jgi:hypothetical protein
MATAIRLIRKSARDFGRVAVRKCLAAAAIGVNVDFMVVEYLVNLKALSDFYNHQAFSVVCNPVFSLGSTQMGP